MDEQTTYDDLMRLPREQRFEPKTLSHACTQLLLRLLGEPDLPQGDREKVIAELGSRHSEPSSLMPVGKKSRNRLLGIISLLLKLAAIVPVFFAFLVVFTEDDQDSPGLFLMVLCAGGIMGLLLFALGELIRVFDELSANVYHILTQLQGKSRT